MEIIEKKYLNNEFERKIVEVRKLEAQKHHQNDMYAKPLQNKRKDYQGRMDMYICTPFN